jgi:penicillin-binding protein 1A
MPSKKPTRRIPVVAGREEPFSEEAHRYFLLALVVLAAAVVFALALLPALGAAGTVLDRFNDELDAIGAELDLNFPRPPERSTIYASDGTVLATLFLDENRAWVRLKDINDVTQQAVIAIEDKNFYQHPGIDTEGIIRALIRNLEAGEIEQGASTITQQLVRNVFPEVGTERTFARKVQEARLAMRLEQEYTKDQILELYLNEVYLGRGIYGVGTAAEFYFGKQASRLTLSEAATVAGLISSPETYNPLNDMGAAVARRNVVIDQMLGLGWITEAEAASARAEAIELRSKAQRPLEQQRVKAPFFVEFLKRQILDDPRFGGTHEQRIRTLFQGGLDIHTTLVPRLERSGHGAITAHLPDTDDPDSAIAAVDARTGAIRVLIGGRDFEASQVNLATGQGGTGRQAGSAFKPFTLVAAFEQGIPPGKVYESTSGQIVDCSPYGPTNYPAVNADGGGEGYIDLWTATQRSVNAVFVQLAVDTGPPNIVEAAHRMGIESELPAVCSLTLGTGEVTPLEMAAAYQTLATGGIHCEPFAMTKVVDRDGEILLQQKKGDCERVVEEDVANLVVAMLQRVVSGGTGYQANLGTWPVFGKTGSTNDYADAWFTGCTFQVCSSVWVGHLEGRVSMVNVNGVSRVYGGTFPAMIWHDFMLAVMDGREPVAFPPAPPQPSATVPDVVGLTIEAAEEVLADANLTAIVKKIPRLGPKNKVLGQSPEPGASVTAGSGVEIQIPSGKPGHLRVPDVVGLTEEDAVARLAESGFKVARQTVFTRHRQLDGYVESQSPEAGTKYPQGHVVTINVYEYYRPEPPPPSPEPSPQPKPSPSPTP